MKDVDLNYWPAHSSTAVLKEHEAGDGWSPCFLNFLIRHTSSWSNVWGFNELLFLSLLSLSFFFPLSLPLCQLQIGEQPASWGNQLFEQCVYNLVMLPIKTANLSWDCNSLVFLNQKKKRKNERERKNILCYFNKCDAWESELVKWDNFVDHKRSKWRKKSFTCYMQINGSRVRNTTRPYGYLNV